MELEVIQQRPLTIINQVKVSSLPIAEPPYDNLWFYTSVYDPVSGLWSSKRIDFGSVGGGGGGGSDTNFANTDLTFTGFRVHEMNGNGFVIRNGRYIELRTTEFFGEDGGTGTMATAKLEVIEGEGGFPTSSQLILHTENVDATSISELHLSSTQGVRVNRNTILRNIMTSINSTIFADINGNVVLDLGSSTYEGIVEFADNATASAALGLNRMYRTGDVLKITHP
jgi:hypothetical protein